MIMETTQEKPISTFAKMIDKLWNKSEDELKMLYIKLFSTELIDEWKNITEDSDFGNVYEEEIVKVIQKNRYKN